MIIAYLITAYIGMADIVMVCIIMTELNTHAADFLFQLCMQTNMRMHVYVCTRACAAVCARHN